MPRTGLGSELGRKGVHIGMGAFAMLLRFLTPLQAAACAGLALLFNAFALHRLTRRSLLRAKERQSGYSPGILLYPAAVLGLVVVFHRRLELAAAAWGLLAVGDGMATLAGVGLGGARLPWNREKSWSGLLAFVLFGTAASAFLLWWVMHGEPAGAAGGWIGSSFVGRAGAPEPGWLLLGCLAATVAAAFAESLRTGIDDNVLVPLVGGAVLFSATLVDPDLLGAAGETILRDGIRGGAVNAVLAVAAFAAGGVGASGAIWGFVLGTLLFAFGGWPGFLMLLGFFVMGTATTRAGYARKAALGIAQERGGRRGAKNAFANTTAGVGFAFLAVATPHHDVFSLALVAAFATAASDTVASEIGQAYGRRHVLVTSFRRVPAGTDGAVSVEGTLAGILASLVLAGVAWVSGLVSAPGVGLVVVAAFVGTTLESYLGATLERVRTIDNELVNFANTLAGGLSAIALSYLVSVLR